MGETRGLFNYLTLVLYIVSICLSFNLYAKIPPVFPEVQHFFDIDTSKESDSLNHLFGRLGLKQANKVQFSLNHQSREWEYNWYLITGVFPTEIGTFSLGYSNYGVSNLPTTSEDALGPYVSSYHSDTFGIIGASYQPMLDIINLHFLLQYKYRILGNQKAQSFNIDIALSSDDLLNNQVGLKTTNLIATEHKWSGKSKEEVMPKYVGVYFIQPFYRFTFLVDHDFSINYNNLNITIAQGSFSLDKMLSIYSSYKIERYKKTTTFGSHLNLTETFSLSYAYKVEKSKIDTLDVHSLGIGVIL